MKKFSHKSSRLTGRRIPRAGLSFCLLLNLSATCLQAAEYYVSPNGNDSANGDLAAPWLTVNRAANAALPGDTVLLRAGMYRETLRPAVSGTASQPITFQAFENEVVVLSAADPVGSWTQETGSIYQANVALPIANYSDDEFAANQVFIGSEMMTEARWPNTTDSLNSPVLAGGNVSPVVAPGGNGLSSIYRLDNAELPALGAGWIGATIWAQEWFVTTTGTVTAQTLNAAGLPELTAQMTWPWRGAYWHYLTGVRGLLDAPREWFYDPATSKLSLWSPDGAAPQNVSAKQRLYCADLSDRSHITLRGLTLFAGTITTSSASEGITLDRLKASYLSHSVTLPPIPPSAQAAGTDQFWVLASRANHSGIQLRGRGHILQNSSLLGSSGNGVLLEGSDHVVTNNFIQDTAYIGSYASPIRINGAGHRIVANTIVGAGRDSITADWHTNGFSLPDVRIAYNDISGFGALNNDLGGIYLAANLDLTNTQIDHNNIHDPYGFSVFWDAAGIYTDVSSYNATVNHNLIWRMEVSLPIGLKISQRSGTNIQERIYHNTSLSKNSLPTENASIINNLLVGDDTLPPAAIASNNLSATTNPQFVSPNFADFSLQGNSPAIDAGLVLPGFNDDFAGSAPDLGAFERGRPAWRAGSAVAAGTYSLYDATSPLAQQFIDGQSYELGTRIFAAASGVIEKIRYFRPPGETGTHTGNIWSDTGVLLASATFTNETSSGWQEVSVTPPLAISADAAYFVTVNANTAYLAERNARSGIRTRGPLRALHNGSRFSTTPGQFPNQGRSTDYFRDVVFTTTGADQRVPFALSLPSQIAGSPNSNSVVKVRAFGALPLSYQWESRTSDVGSYQPISGANSDTYSLVNAGFTDVRTQLRCVITNAFGRAVTNSALLFMTPTASGNGLRGAYFNNTTRTGTPAFERTDPQVSYDWVGDSPVPGVINNDFWSTRWTGQVQPTVTGTWTFFVRSDDGARLTINGQVIIDQLINQAAFEYSGVITLQAGRRYDIQLDYFDFTSNASCELRWSNPLVPKQIIPAARLYSMPLPQSYAAWAAVYLATSAAGDQIATADPDADGLNNLLEYALSGDPLSVDVAKIAPRLTRTVAGNGSVGLTLSYRKAAPELIYSVQACTNLTATSGPTAWNEVTTPELYDPLTDTYRNEVIFPANSPLGFIRLRVRTP